MPKGSREVTEHRRDEILDACAELYRTLPYCEVTMKKIAEKTTFSRPSIYNYFQTMGEIFLGLLEREYAAWNADLLLMKADHERMSPDELAAGLAASLSRRETLLKIQSLNLSDIENTSRIERLTEFKKACSASITALDSCLEKFMPAMSAEDRLDFRRIFLPFLFSVYPFANPTEKQCKAMDMAGMPHEAVSIYDLIYKAAKKLLG